MAIVYKVTNQITGKLYIGATLNLTRRITKHKHMAFTKNSMALLHQDMRKYGFFNFWFSIVEECDNYLEKEKYYIKKLNTLAPIGYNETIVKKKYIVTGDSKAVQVIDLEKNETLEFYSISEASRFIGVSVGSVTMSIKRKNEIKGRYIVKYKDDERTIDQVIQDIEEQKAFSYMHLSSVRLGKIPPNVRAVKLINVETKQELTFKTVKDAATYLNRQTTNISHACNNVGSVVAGHYAEYLKE